MVTIPTQFGQIFQVFPGAAKGASPIIGGSILNRILGRPSFVPFPIRRPYLPKIGGGTKATIATIGTTAGIFGTSYLFTQTPGGLQTTQAITGATNNITRFFSQNPLLLVALIALGIIVVIKK